MRPITLTVIIILVLVIGVFFIKSMLGAKERTGQVGEEGLKPSDEGQTDKQVEEYPAKEEKKPEQVKIEITRAEAQDLALKHVKDAFYNSYIFDLTSDELENREENIKKYTEWVEGYTIAMSETSLDSKYWIVRVHNQKKSLWPYFSEEEITVEVRSREDIRMTKPASSFDEYFKQMQEAKESYEETANLLVMCATEVIFDIESVCKSSSGYDVLIENSGKTPIKSWKIRVYQNPNTIKAFDKAVETNAFGTATITITETDINGLTEVTQIEAFPVITRSNKDIICSQNIDSYGDANGAPITMAC